MDGFAISSWRKSIGAIAVDFVFNPTRPFAGEWEFSWLWGATAILGGLLYGCLRERTGSIWAGTIVYALIGVYWALGQVFL